MVTSQIHETVKSAFNFSVDKFPLAGPDGMTTPWYGLFRSDNMQVVGNGSVTNRYNPHTTDDVLALVDAAGEAFDGEIDVKCHFRDGHYVSVSPTKAERRAIFGTADNVFPRVIISAGYDGKSFKATMGYYRDICRNMSIMRQVNGTTVSIRHDSNLRSKMDDLITSFETVKKSWTTLADVIVALETREVQMTSFLNTIYGEPEDSKRAVTVHKNRTEAIFKRLQRERMVSGRPVIGEDFTVSAWEAFNAIQGFYQHDAQAKSEFKGEFDRILRASNQAEVLQAEKMVLQLVA